MQEAVVATSTRLDAPLLLDGERLRTIRRDRGITDGALRKAAGCPLSTWRALVAGRVEADPALVQVLCWLLGVAAHDLAAVEQA